jgi:hypothetical protein
MRRQSAAIEREAEPPMYRTVMPRAIVLLVAAAMRIAAQQPPPPPSEPTRAPETEWPCIEPPSDGTIVKVIDGTTKNPAAGAIVTWFEERADGERDDIGPEPRLTTNRRRFGKSVKCGADGTTRVGKFAALVASIGDRYAGTWRSRRGQPLVLELKPRRSITVHVVDREGKAVAEVPIELRTSEAGSGSTAWTVSTDAKGNAEIGPLDLFASFDSEALRGLWVAVDAPLGAPIRASLTLAELPSKPIDLTLPPTGRLVIDVVDADGQPIESLGSTSVRSPWNWEKDLPDVTPGTRWPVVSWHAYDRRAHYDLPHVELGLRLVVDSDKDEHSEAKQVVDGPTKPGETRAVQLVVPPMPATQRLRGRILDEKGDPLAGTTVEVLWNSDTTRVSRRALGQGTTGSDGRLEVQIDEFAGGRFEEEFEPWLEAIVPRADGDGILASGMIALPKTNEIGGGDFGDIRVHPSPRFASGLVVDDAGAPVEGAAIEVSVYPRPTGGISGLSGDFTDRMLTATTKADGRFTLWGDPPDGEISISASPGTVDRPVPLWNSSESHDLASGATDLRFVLWRCGTIVAHIVGGAEETDHLSFSASAERSDGQHVGGWSGGVSAEGEVETEIPIGFAKLQISRGGTVIAVRDHLEVKPGAIVELDPIDLSAVAHQVELTIVDELGKPVPAGWIVMPDPDDDKRIAEMKAMFGPEHSAMFHFPRSPNVTVFKDGKATLRSVESLPPFAVGAAGRTAVVLRHPAAAERVVLELAPHVAIVLEYDGDAVPEPLHFFVSIAADNDDSEWFRFGPGDMSHADSLDLPRLHWITLERDRPVELPIRCLGKTQLDCVLGEKQLGGFCGTTIGGDPRQIEVERTGDRQVFHVKVARTAIDAVLKEREEQQKDEERDR